MIAAQFVMPKCEIEHFLDGIATSTCRIQPMDSMPLGSFDAFWMRYQCNTENSQAIIAIAEHGRLPNAGVVTISTDIRRLWRITRLFGDSELVKAVCRKAMEFGGRPFVE